VEIEQDNRQVTQCQHLQELPEQTSSQQDGLLHGLDVRLALWPHLVRVHGSGAAAPGKLPGKLCIGAERRGGPYANAQYWGCYGQCIVKGYP